MHKANKPVANRSAKFKDLKNQEITLHEAEGLVSGDQWEYILYAFYTCKGDFALPAPELFQFYSTISILLHYFGWRFSKVFSENSTKISHAGKTTELTYFRYRIFSRLQQFQRMIKSYGFNKIGRRQTG